MGFLEFGCQERKSNTKSTRFASPINIELLEQRQLLSAPIVAVPFEYNTGTAASIAVDHHIDKNSSLVRSDSSTSLPAPIATSPGTATSPGPVITTLTQTLSWQAITGVTGYQIDVYNLTARRSISYITSTNVDSFKIPSTALIASDSYAWNVRALDGAESGSPSTYLYFQATASAGTKLAAPVAKSPGSTSSPGSVISTLTPTLSWQTTTGGTVTAYQINLYNLTTRRSVSYETSARVDSFTIPSTTPLTAGDVYAWNVRALDGKVSGPLSSYLYFHTAAQVTLPAPVAVSPGSTTSPGPVITALTPTLSWQAITGVTFTGYQINLYDVTTGVLASYHVGASVDSFTVSSALTAGNSYEWNVRALNGTVSGPPSANLYFQAQAQSIPTPDSGTLELIVNPVTGDVLLDGNDADVVSLQVTSASDSLVASNWLDLNSHGFTTWAAIIKKTNGIAEYDTQFLASGGYTVLNGAIDYGDVFKTTGTKDLVFKYGVVLSNDTTVNTLIGNIIYETPQ